MAIFPGAVSTDSDLYIAVNDKFTTLTVGLSPSDTTVTVADTTGFPTVGFITADLEIIKYTGTTPTSFTGCTRGSDGTTAVAHLSGINIFHYVIAVHHNVLKDEIKALETTLINYTTVKDYGAVGDGVANDTAAINSALASGKPVYFPPGTYLTTGGHFITTQRIKGAGKDLTIIKRSSGTATVFSMENSGAIEDLTVDCNSLNGTGIKVTNATFGQRLVGVVRNVTIKNAGASVVPKTITAATNANPCVITATAHGFSNGDMVSIKNVNGFKSATNPDLSIVNNTFRISNVTLNTFEITENTTSWTAYVSGGTAEIASYALTLEETGSGGGANSKIIDNVEFTSNYGHIYIGNCSGSSFDDIVMRGFTTGYSIYISNLATEQLTFTNCYMESGVATNAYGIRDVSFKRTTVYLPASGAWDRPWYFSVGYNTAFGSAGGEVAQISFDGLTITRQVNNAAIPIFDTNNYQLFMTNIHILESASTGWKCIKNRGTYNARFQDFTVESTNAWDLFDGTAQGGNATVAENINYTQGVVGTATWSCSVLAGTTTTLTEVRHSNLNHTLATPAVARLFSFENISGNLDLTNAVSPVRIWNITGTVTDPNNVALFTQTYRYHSVDGTAASPTYGFASSPTTGIYLVSSDRLGFSIAGTEVVDLQAAGFSTTLAFSSSLAAFGAISTTSSFSGGLVGMSARNTSNTANSSAAYIARVDGTSGGDAYFVAQIAAGSTWAFGTDNSDGDKFKICLGTDIGSGDSITIDTSHLVTFTGSLKLPAASVSAPALFFSNDPDTGLYSRSAGIVSVTSNSTLVAEFRDSGNSSTVPYTISAVTQNALTVSASNPGDILGIFVRNTGTTALSDARVYIRVDSNTAGDPYTSYQVADTGGKSWVTGIDNSDSDKFKIAQDSGLGSNDLFIIDPTTLGVANHGTNTNDSAAAGFVGEFVSSTVSNVSLPASATFGEITSITLTAGDWDISLVAVFTRNGATYTSVLNEVFIGTAAGNNGTGSVTGSNYLLEDRSDTAWLRHSFSVAPYRVSITASTTYYLKVYTDTYTAGTPQASGRISARRVR